MNVMHPNGKSTIKFLVYSLYYVDACEKVAGPISASSCPDSTATFEEMSQRSATLYELTGSRFEPQTCSSRDERATARHKNSNSFLS